MTSQWENRLSKIRHSKSYLMFVSAHLTTTGSCAYSMYHTVLPYSLRDTHSRSAPHDVNVTSYTELDPLNPDNETLPHKIGKDIGLILGTGVAGQLVASLALGCLLKRFSLRFHWILGSFLNIMAISIALFTDNVALLCASSAFASSGMIWQTSTVYVYHAEFANNQQEFDSLIGWTNVFNSVGLIAGHGAVAAAYQFFGRRTTFGGIIALLTLDSVFRVSLPPIDAGYYDHHSEKPRKPIQPHPDKYNADEYQQGNPGNHSFQALLSKWLHFLRKPTVVLLALQTCIVYICSSILWASSPNYLANELGAQQWQIGLTMSLGQGLGLLGMFIVTLTVKTHRFRLAVTYIVQLTLAAATFCYPFATTVWVAMAPDLIYRSCRDVLVTMIVSHYPHIEQTIADARMTYTFFDFSVSAGMLIGYYGYRLLVAMVTFKWLYIGVGVTLVTMLMTYIPYCTVPELVKTNVTLCSGEVHVSSLAVDNMTSELRASRLVSSDWLTKSRMTNDSAARSRSKSLATNGSLIINPNNQLQLV